MPNEKAKLELCESRQQIRLIPAIPSISLLVCLTMSMRQLTIRTEVCIFFAPSRYASRLVILLFSYSSCSNTLRAIINEVT